MTTPDIAATPIACHGCARTYRSLASTLSLAWRRTRSTRATSALLVAATALSTSARTRATSGSAVARTHRSNFSTSAINVFTS